MDRSECLAARSILARGMEWVMKRRRKKIELLDVIIYLVMAVVIVIMLCPFLLIVSSSLSDPVLVMQNKVGLLPKGFTLQNYKTIFGKNDIWLSYWNTIRYTLVGTLIGVVLTVMTAYPLSRKDFVGKRKFSMLLAFTMIFAGGLVPNFMVVRSLNWLDTIWAVTVPGCMSAYYIIITRTFFESIPVSLEESARIDGANDFYILTRIILPLSGPIVATLTLFYAVAHWNNFFGPLIYLNSKSMFPLQIMLRSMLIEGNVADYAGQVDTGNLLVATSIKYTCIVVTSLPIICVYPFLQKYFVKGVMVGAVKG